MHDQTNTYISAQIHRICSLTTIKRRPVFDIVTPSDFYRRFLSTDGTERTKGRATEATVTMATVDGAGAPANVIQVSTVAPLQADITSLPPHGGPVSYMSEAPPSYEQSLQHRRFECGPSAVVVGPAFGGSYPGPPNSYPPGTSRGSYLSRMISRESDGDDATSVSSNTDSRECFKIALPPMHMCMAVTCLIFNFLIPGSGTILAGFGVFCCTRGEEWTTRKRFDACGLSIGIGFAQLLLTPLLLIGWVWSIMWGFAFVGSSHEEYHRKRTRDDRRADPLRGIVGPNGQVTTSMPQPPSYSRSTSPTQGALAARIHARLVTRPANTNANASTVIEIQPQIHAPPVERRESESSSSAVGVSPERCPSEIADEHQPTDLSDDGSDVIAMECPHQREDIPTTTSVIGAVADRDHAEITAVSS